MQDLQHLLEGVADWVRGRPDVVAVGLAGSHARGTAGASSDVDLVVLVEDPAALLGDDTWLAQFGNVTSVANEDWGAVQSRRVHYHEGPQVEFGLTSPAWAELPLDMGTARVIRDGFRVLHDPKGVLARALQAVQSTDDLVVDADVVLRPFTFHGICALNRVDVHNRTANVGFWLRTSSTGKGLATRATARLLVHGLRDLQLERVEVAMSVANTPSVAVARRLDLHEEGVRSQAIRVAGDQHDARVFAAFPADVDRLVT